MSQSADTMVFRSNKKAPILIESVLTLKNFIEINRKILIIYLAGKLHQYGLNGYLTSQQVNFNQFLIAIVFVNGILAVSMQ